MKKTEIEYLDYTWNPIVMKCNRVSKGCANCWHLTRAKMLSYNKVIPPWKRFVYSGLHEPVIDSKELSAPTKLKNPSKIGVQFMGDLFHSSVTYSQIEQVLKICSEYQEHTFFMLTKRVERMMKILNLMQDKSENIWFGVSVEDQESANHRIPYLIETSVRNRWISVEPLLENTDIAKIGNLRNIKWIVCGMETGHSGRPMRVEWVANIAADCSRLDIPFFFKNAHNNNFFIPDGIKIQQYPEGLEEERINA